MISLNQFSDVLASSVRGIANKLDTRVKGIPVIIYNALGFQANQTIEIEINLSESPKGISVFDTKGKKVASQLLAYRDGKARILMDATVPAVGYAVYDVRISGDKDVTLPSVLQKDGTYQFENSIYQMKLDVNGRYHLLGRQKN